MDCVSCSNDAFNSFNEMDPESRTTYRSMLIKVPQLSLWRLSDTGVIRRLDRPVIHQSQTPSAFSSFGVEPLSDVQTGCASRRASSCLPCWINSSHNTDRMPVSSFLLPNAWS